MTGIPYEVFEKFTNKLEGYFQHAIRVDPVEAYRIHLIQDSMLEAIRAYYDNRLKLWWNSLSTEEQDNHIKEIEEEIAKNKTTTLIPDDDHLITFETKMAMAYDSTQKET